MASARLGRLAGARWLATAAAAGPARAAAATATGGSGGGSITVQVKGDGKVSVLLPLHRLGGTKMTVTLGQRLHEFLLDVNHELLQERVRGPTRPRLVDGNGRELDLELPMHEVLQRDFRVDWDQNTLNYSPADFTAAVRDHEAAIAEHETELARLLALKTRLDRRAELYGHVVRGSVFAFLVSQLGAIIYLTYDIGWDIMEPTTYLLGLSYSAWVLFVHNLTSRDFAFPVHVEELIVRYRNRLYARNGLENARIQTLEHALRRLRGVMRPAAAPLFSVPAAGSEGKRLFD